MFPAPRQRGSAALASPEPDIAALANEAPVIHGREDRVMPLESSIRLHRLIPRSRLRVFGQCGHWTRIEHNTRFCDPVGDFIGEQPLAAHPRERLHGRGTIRSPGRFDAGKRRRDGRFRTIVFSVRLLQVNAARRRRQ